MAPSVVQPDQRRLDRAAVGRVLFIVSALTALVALFSALGLWSVLDVERIGLDERGAYYIFAGAIYVLAAFLYAAWRTRLLGRVRHISGDVKLMLGANLAIGGAVVAALIIVVFAALSVIRILAIACAGLVSRSLS